MHLFHQFLRCIKRTIWAVIVAYMLGMHNIYKQEEKTPGNIVITIEEDGEQGDSAPIQ